MNYRDFKGTPVSEVGLGTWQLGSSDWGNVDPERAFSILKAYTDEPRYAFAAVLKSFEVA